MALTRVLEIVFRNGNVLHERLSAESWFRHRAVHVGNRPRKNVRDGPSRFRWCANAQSLGPSGRSRRRSGVSAGARGQQQQGDPRMKPRRVDHHRDQSPASSAAVPAIASTPIINAPEVTIIGLKQGDRAPPWSTTAPWRYVRIHELYHPHSIIASWTVMMRRAMIQGAERAARASGDDFHTQGVKS